MGWYDKVKSAFTRRADATQNATTSIVRRNAGRMDGWHNASTGLGVAGFDQALNTKWQSGVNLTLLPQVLTSLNRYNPIANRIVEKQVSQALSKGVWWSLENPRPGSVAQITAEWERIAAWRWIHEARVWGRLYGAGLLVVHLDDLSFPSEPLPATFTAIKALRAVSWCKVSHVKLYESGLDTGYPELYYIQGGHGMAMPVHESRVWRFDGAKIDRESYEANGYTHDTVLNRVYATLRRVGAGEDSLASQLDDATKGVWKIKGLHEQILAGNADFIENWIQTVEMAWSSFRGAALDKDGEDFQWLSRPMKESVDVYRALMFTIAAAADMPMTELFGMAPAGLSTDDQSGTRKWISKINAEERAGALDPAIGWLADLVSRQRSTPELSGAVIGWEWPSLWTMTAKEEAEVRKLTAETDKLYVESGVLLQGEVTRSRFGGARYSPETQLDEEARAAIAEDAGSADLTPVEKLQQGRLAIDALHTPATAQSVADILGWPVPTPEEITAYWSKSLPAQEEAPAPKADSITVAELHQRVDGEDGDSTSVGIFLRLPDPLATVAPTLSRDSSPPHVTFLIIGDVTGREDELLTLLRSLAPSAPTSRAILGRVEALTNPRALPVIYQRVRFQRPGQIGSSFPRLDRWRDRIVEALRERHFPVLDHSPGMWHPHFTLAYLETPDAVWDGVPVTGSWGVSEVEVWGLPDGPHVITLGSLPAEEL